MLLKAGPLKYMFFDHVEKFLFLKKTFKLGNVVMQSFELNTEKSGA